MAELILVGTVHGDPHGYQRAWRLLEMVRPRLIAVEVSQFSLRYRQKHGRDWQQQWQQALARIPPAARQHLALKRIAAQLAWPFEVRVARDYARRYDRHWRAIDTGRLSRVHLPRYRRELLTPENLRNLLSTEDGDWQQYIENEYRRASLALHSPDRFVGLTGEPGQPPAMAVREKIIAQRLRALAGAASPLVYLGGWTHLLSGKDPPTVAQHLEDLQPQCLLLHQVDNPAPAPRFRVSGFEKNNVK